MNVVCVLTGGPFDGETREMDYHGVPASVVADDLPHDIVVADYSVTAPLIVVPGEEPVVHRGTHGSYQFTGWTSIGEIAAYSWVAGA